MIAPIMGMVAKGGRCVVTAVANIGRHRRSAQPVRPGAAAEAAGRHASSAAPTPATTSPACCASTRSGKLKLDELVTTTYELDDINQGYQDMRDGKNIRGVILY